MHRAFNDRAKFPDLIITCNDRVWYCHKVVLCARSDWFQKACSGKFKEGGADTIAIQEESSDALEVMLRFCYTLDLGTEGKASALFSIQVFALGEKYFVKGLPKLAADAFVTSARSKERNTEDLTAAITEVYSNTSDTDKMLRNAIKGVMMESDGQLMCGQHETFFHQLVEGLPEFAVDIAKALVENRNASLRPASSVLSHYKCPKGHCPGELPGYMSMDTFRQGYRYRCSACGEDFLKTKKQWQAYAVYI